MLVKFMTLCMNSYLSSNGYLYRWHSSTVSIPIDQCASFKHIVLATSQSYIMRSTKGNHKGFPKIRHLQQLPCSKACGHHFVNWGHLYKIHCLYYLRLHYYDPEFILKHW